MTLMSEFLKDPRIAEAVTPEVMAFLESNQPPEDASPDEQIGWWQGTTAGVLTELAKAKQRIRELEADR